MMKAMNSNGPCIQHRHRSSQMCISHNADISVLCSMSVKLGEFIFVDLEDDYAMKTVSNTMMILFLLLLGRLYLVLRFKLVHLEIVKLDGLVTLTFICH